MAKLIHAVIRRNRYRAAPLLISYQAKSEQPQAQPEQASEWERWVLRTGIVGKSFMTMNRSGLYTDFT